VAISLEEADLVIQVTFSFGTADSPSAGLPDSA
jgi:hypothetical protein